MTNSLAKSGSSRSPAFLFLVQQATINKRTVNNISTLILVQPARHLDLTAQSKDSKWIIVNKMTSYNKKKTTKQTNNEWPNTDTRGRGTCYVM